MKKLLLMLLTAIFIYSCESKDEPTLSESDSNATTKALDETLNVSSNVPYTFPNLTDPEVWKKFQCLEEQQAACQVPEAILKAMSTENLIETCMNYPLYSIYSAYNNELDGIDVIMQGFNGFQELLRRDSVADKLIGHYEKFDLDKIQAEVDLRTNKINFSKRTILHVGYMELILSSKNFSDKYSKRHLLRLKNAINDKYEKKVAQNNLYSIFSVRKSLLLGAKIKLKEGGLSSKDKESLEHFAKNGAVAEPTEYTKISKLLMGK